VVQTAPSETSGAPAIVGRYQRGGPDLLVSDTRVVLALLNEARYRTIARTFGVSSRSQANLLTLVLAMMFADGARTRGTQVKQGARPPTKIELALGLAVCRELLRGLAGRPEGDPMFGSLVTIGILGNMIRPFARRAAEHSRGVSQRASTRFRDRYGELRRSRRGQ
jgi:hypothetical protein